MTTNLFRALYLGQDLPDENLRDIPYPRFEVHWHVMYKCVEVGGLLGMCFFGPIAGALRGKSMAGVIKSANSVRQISITQDYEPLLSIRRRIIKKMLCTTVVHLFQKWFCILFHMAHSVWHW